VTRILSRSVIALSVVALGLVLASPSDARAEGFISGLVGYNFGGDAGCASATNCQDKHTNWGGSVGSLGIIGFEEELAYAKNFFGTTPGNSNSVLTLMSNLLIAPGIGPVHPYVTGGVGLMRSQAEFTPSQLLSISDNQFAWDAGGGVMVFFGAVGVRGDIRYFHSFQNSTLPFIGTVGSSGTKLDYGRASASIVLKF
jgi:opacity protein-like surface antigen